MDLWIGPAIVAALVSALVTAAGWFVSARQTAIVEQRRREEKVHDFQVALHAEISSDVLSMIVFDRASILAEVKARYASDASYSVLVPHLASNVIFDSIVSEIHVLPGDVIAPVVNYARLRQTLERFASDLRAQSFSQLAAERQIQMYSDYLDTLDRLEALAQQAARALAVSLGINNPVGVQSNLPSASAQDAGQAERDAGQPEKDEP